MAESRIYRPATCAYCKTDTWCELRANGCPQCRGCKVERFFDRVLLAPFGQHLQLWQRRALRALYGTVNERGLRQYRKAYVSTGKQNGKSYKLGGLPIYHLLMEDETNPEAYGVASAKDQAGIVYKAAVNLVKANPMLMQRLIIRESTKRIIRKDRGGLYEVLAADGDVQDGKRGSLLLFDEYHRFKTKKAETVCDVLQKGQVSRMPVVDGEQVGEPLSIIITTSGDEHESPLWAAEYEYACKVRDGLIDDPTYYVQIHQADPAKMQSDKKYWMTREARVLGNPSHEDNPGGFLSDAVLAASMEEAVRRPEKKSSYVRLVLNVPEADSETPAVVMQDWYASGGTEDLRQAAFYDPELLIMRWGLKGRPCYLGLDLAWVTDFTGMTLVFPPEQEGERWKLLFYAWLPEGRVEVVEKLTQQKIAKWVEQGFVLTVPGVRMSLLAVEDKIRWAARTFALREVCYDPYGQVTRSMEILAQEGITCVEIDQKMPSMDRPTKEFLAMLMAGQFEHANNPVANWNVACLALQRDSNDLVRPSKPPRDTAKKRIDLVVATIDALKRAVAVPKEEDFGVLSL